MSPLCICSDRTCRRAASSPTGRIFRICFGVAGSTSVASSGDQTRRPPDANSDSPFQTQPNIRLGWCATFVKRLALSSQT